MKVLIWFGASVYSAAAAALNLAGVGLGGVPVALLAILLIFLPAPALCRLVDRRPAAAPGGRRRSAVSATGAPAFSG